MIEICHGTPFDEDAYVFDDLDALRAMHAARRPLCLFGHTHVQVGHYLSRDQFRSRQRRRHAAAVDCARRSRTATWSTRLGWTAARRRSARCFRHRDTTAREVTIYRVEYPIAKAQARIMQEGLPDVLAQRLRLGR